VQAPTIINIVVYTRPVGGTCVVLRASGRKSWQQRHKTFFKLVGHYLLTIGKASGSLPSVVKKVRNAGGNCNEPEPAVDGDKDQLENTVSDLSGFLDSLDALRSALTMASKPSLGFQQGLLMV
jgi:hypothetical protein